MRLLSAMTMTVALSLLTMAATRAGKGDRAMVDLTVSSPAFENGKPIASKYACDGQDISPPLTWKGIPSGAKSLVLFVEDPDAPIGTWIHWIVYNLPSSMNSLDENLPKTDTLPGGGMQGMTSFKRVGYGGPCPPMGAHRYFFRLYALDKMLNLPSRKGKKEIEAAMKGHVLAQGELMGTYERKK